MKIVLSIAVTCFWIVTCHAQDDRFWLDAQINGKPARLIFDTGSETTGLFPKAVERLGLGIDVPIPDVPAREDGRVGAGKTEAVQLSVWGTTLRTTLHIWPANLNWYDIPQDGTVGWPEVRDNILLMEAATHTLLAVGSVAEEAATWTKFRVLTNYDDLELEIPGSGTNKLVVSIDTGKTAGVTLSPERWQKWVAAHPQRPITLMAYSMFGVGSDVKEESWADEVAFGPLVLADVPVMEANRAETGPVSTGYAGSLGIAALKRLDLVVDGKNHFAYVRPKRTPPAPCQHNRLGAVFMQVALRGDELFAIVARGSPADEAGIDTGDVLLKVGEHDAHNLDTDPFLLPLILVWDRPAGTKYDFTLKRGGEIYRTTVVLREILKPAKSSPVPAMGLASEVKWLRNLGISGYANTNYEQAINNFNEVIRLAPGDAEAFEERGAAWHLKGSNVLAMADFDEALRLRPDFAMALLNRGSAYAGKGEQTNAITDFSRVIEIDPQNAEAFAGRASAYYANHDFGKAAADYDELARLDSNDAGVFVNRGLAHWAEGKLVEAVADFTEAIRLKPDNADAITWRGHVYKQNKEYARALSDYERAVQIEPAKPERYRVVAELLAACPEDSVRDANKAVEYARKACDLTSWKDAANVDTLAMAYASAGDFSNAIKWEQTFLRAKLAEEVRASAQERLRLYQQNKPFRETGQ